MSGEAKGSEAVKRNGSIKENREVKDIEGVTENADMKDNGVEARREDIYGVKDDSQTEKSESGIEEKSFVVVPQVKAVAVEGI